MIRAGSERNKKWN